MEGLESRRGSKAADRAAKLLKSRRGDPSPTKFASSTRPGSATSIVHSATTAHSRAARNEPLYENTYKMEPSRKFPEGSVRNVIKEVLIEALAEVNYEPSTCRQLTKTISDDLRHRVKEMNIQRYKIICLVHIGQLGAQAMRIGSRCLWDTSFDTSTTFEFKNSSLFAVATVYGVYYE